MIEIKLSTSFEHLLAIFFISGIMIYIKNNPDIPKNNTDRRHINPPIFTKFQISVL